MYGAPGEMGGMVIESEEVGNIDDDLRRGGGVSNLFMSVVIIA